MKKTILMLMPGFSFSHMGGAETQALKLIERLIKKDFQILILTHRKISDTEKDFLEGVKIQSVYSILNILLYPISIIISIPTKIKKYYYKKNADSLFPNYSELEKEYGHILGLSEITEAAVFFLNCLFFLIPKKKKFDLIHVHTIEWVAIVGALLGKAFNKKVLVKDSTMNGAVKLRYMPFGKYFQKIVVKNCFFIAITKIIESNFLKVGIPSNRIFKIPNGVEIIPSVCHKRTKNEYKCLFVGNLYQQPAKGIDILLQAWISVINEFPQASLNIVGDGEIELYNTLIKKMGIEKSVRFWGKQTNLQNFYLETDIFILPSRREGMSNALMEAMAYGLPCIASNISGNQDLIVDHFNGLLIPVNNLQQLADSVIYLFNNHDIASEMSKNAKNTIAKTYSMNLVTDKYIDLYTTLLTSTYK